MKSDPIYVNETMTAASSVLLRSGGAGKAERQRPSPASSAVNQSLSGEGSCLSILSLFGLPGALESPFLGPLLPEGCKALEWSTSN